MSKFLTVSVLCLLFSTSVFALPISSCSPSSCPVGYNDEGITCDNGVCTRICVSGTCSDTYTTVYTSSVNLDDHDIRNLDSVSESIEFGEFTPTDTNKCYRFRQTTPKAMSAWLV